MIGVFINCVAVILGSLTGIIFKNLIPKRLTDGIMTGIGLCTVYIGIDSSLCGENTVVLILSIVLGAIIGYLLDIDGKINAFSKALTSGISKKDSSENAAQGFITASLIFCIGAMTIVGSIQAGINGDISLLVTKSVLDLITSIALSATFGFGVLLSTLFVLVFQGSIVLLSSYIGPFLTTPLQNEMICAGSILIIGLGLNILGITKLKIANYLPALIIAPLITYPVNHLLSMIS